MSLRGACAIGWVRGISWGCCWFEPQVKQTGEKELLTRQLTQNAFCKPERPDMYRVCQKNWLNCKCTIFFVPVRRVIHQISRKHQQREPLPSCYIDQSSPLLGLAECTLLCVCVYDDDDTVVLLAVIGFHLCFPFQETMRNKARSEPFFAKPSSSPKK